MLSVCLSHRRFRPKLLFAELHPAPSNSTAATEPIATVPAATQRGGRRLVPGKISRFYLSPTLRRDQIQAVRRRLASLSIPVPWQSDRARHETPRAGLALALCRQDFCHPKRFGVGA